MTAASACSHSSSARLDGWMDLRRGSTGGLFDWSNWGAG